MTDLISNNIYLTLLLPLWVFLIIMLGRFFSVYVNKTIIYTLTLLSSAIGLGICTFIYCNITGDTIYESQIPFLKINDFILNGGIYIDKISLIFAIVLFAVSFLVQLFSIFYMKTEKKKYRFFALLNLFNFSLAGLFFSPNLFQIYIFWEIAGITSYFLIGFDYNKTEKSIASKKVFIINKIGDTAFIGAIIMLAYLMFEYAPDKSLANLSLIDMTTISTLTSAYTSTPLFLIICGMLIFASTVKSAQFPFYTWLQDAMEAKLPVSALLHSATLVASGIYLLIRTTFLFELNPYTYKFILVLGLITAVMCSLSACTQTNPKKALAYSTSAQLGLIFFAIGIVNIKVAVALFCTHAIIKSMLFLSLPTKETGWSYIKFILFIIGGLSLSGLVFSGMISKEMLALNTDNNGTIIISILAFLTAFYIIRLALVMAEEKGLIKERPSLLEIVPIISLLIINIGLYFYMRKTCNYQVAEPFWAALTGWLCTYILYIKHAFRKVPVLYPICYNGFYLDKFYTTTIVKLYNFVTDIHKKFDENILGNDKLIIFLSKLPVKLTNWVEENIMNKSVKIVVNSAKLISKTNIKMQTGNIQRYNLYAFIIITILVSVLVIAYTTIISNMRG